MPDDIRIIGAREHNLKNIDVRIPRNPLGNHFFVLTHDCEFYILLPITTHRYAVSCGNMQGCRFFNC